MGGKRVILPYLFFFILGEKPFVVRNVVGNQPSINENDFSTSVRLPCTETFRFPSYVVSGTGCLIYEHMTLGASENTCLRSPCRRPGLLGDPVYSQEQDFQAKKLQIRAYHHFKKYQWIFFFLSSSILLTFAAVLKPNSLRLVFLVRHMGTFIKLWQFQFVWLSS